MNTQGNIDQERLAFIKARQKLLQFFLAHIYSNNIDTFNARNEEYILPFKNDAERMKYFIDRFNQYFNDKTYDHATGEYKFYIPFDDLEYQEDYTGIDVTNELIHDIKNSIKTIKEYYGLV